MSAAEGGRIGVVLPSNNVVLEPELYAHLPRGATAHFSRIAASGGDAAALDRMARQAPRAVRELAGADVDIYVYACFSTTLIRQPGWDERFTLRVQSTTGRKSFTAASATVAALKAFSAHSISVITPFAADIHGRVAGFFARHGIEVVSESSLNITDLRAVGMVDSARLASLVEATLLPAARAACILATDIPTFELIAPLEARLGLPVVSTNEALLWLALRILGHDDHPPLGALFDQ
jgi:maleate isomerase